MGAARANLMIVVDSSVLISALRGVSSLSTEMLRDQAGRNRIIVGDIVLLEVLQGARSDSHALAIEAQLRRYAIVHMLDDRMATAAAANFRRLRALGVTIRKTVDLIIGTFCIEHGCRLLQDDRDFAPMAEHLGLQLA
jgi:predicted nucleic acid-binding protein